MAVATQKTRERDRGIALATWTGTQSRGANHLTHRITSRLESKRDLETQPSRREAHTHRITSRLESKRDLETQPSRREAHTTTTRKPRKLMLSRLAAIKLHMT